MEKIHDYTIYTPEESKARYGADTRGWRIEPPWWAEWLASEGRKLGPYGPELNTRTEARRAAKDDWRYGYYEPTEAALWREEQKAPPCHLGCHTGVQQYACTGCYSQICPDTQPHTIAGLNGDPYPYCSPCYQEWCTENPDDPDCGGSFGIVDDDDDDDDDWDDQGDYHDEWCDCAECSTGPDYVARLDRLRALDEGE